MFLDSHRRLTVADGVASLDSRSSDPVTFSIKGPAAFPPHLMKHILTEVYCSLKGMLSTVGATCPEGCPPLPGLNELSRETNKVLLTYLLPGQGLPET